MASKPRRRSESRHARFRYSGSPSLPSTTPVHAAVAAALGRHEDVIRSGPVGLEGATDKQFGVPEVRVGDGVGIRGVDQGDAALQRGVNGRGYSLGFVRTALVGEQAGTEADLADRQRPDPALVHGASRRSAGGRPGVCPAVHPARHAEGIPLPK